MNACEIWRRIFHFMNSQFHKCVQSWSRTQSFPVCSCSKVAAWPIHTCLLVEIVGMSRVGFHLAGRLLLAATWIGNLSGCSWQRATILATSPALLFRQNSYCLSYNFTLQSCFKVDDYVCLNDSHTIPKGFSHQVVSLTVLHRIPIHLLYLQKPSVSYDDLTGTWFPLFCGHWLQIWSLVWKPYSMTEI